MTVTLIAVIWALVSLPVGVLIGRTITTADRATTRTHSRAATGRRGEDQPVDLLADQPTEILAPSEVERRFTALTRSWS